MANEIKRIYFGSQASPVVIDNLEDGTFTLTFGGDTTASIAYNASAATVQTELEALASIGSGNVAVAVYPAFPSTQFGYEVEFQGALADTNVGDLTATPSLKQKADTIAVTVDQTGSAGGDEIQVITNALAGSSGGFELNGVSVSVDEGSGYTNIHAALDTIFGSGNTSTSIAGNFVDLIVSFTGSLAATNVTEMTVANDTTGQSVGVTTSQQGGSGQPHVVTFSLSDSPTEGSFKLELQANQSFELDWNAAGSSVASAVASIGTYGYSSFASDPMGQSPWTVTSYSNIADPGTFTGVEQTPLRKSCAVEVVTSQEGEGVGGGSTGAGLTNSILLNQLSLVG